jgi:hypothetical protein
MGSDLAPDRLSPRRAYAAIALVVTMFWSTVIVIIVA